MSSTQRTRAILLVVLLLGLAVAAAPAWAAPAAQDNLLNNGGFEGGTYEQVADGSTRVPNGWKAWWAQSANTLYKPAYELESHPPHVRQGAWAARFYTAYTNHDAGLYQQVAVTQGATYRFVIWGFTWSTQNPVVGTPSEADSTLRVGIDPTGGTDPFAASVVWSAGIVARDTYQKLTVEAAAKAATITVFVRNTTAWPVARNDAFWDDAELKVVGGAAAQPTAAAPQPTAAPSSVKATPDANGRIVHTVGAGDSLSYIAWLYGVPMDQIRQLNSLQNDIVVLGTRLVIQEGYTPTPEPTAVVTETPTPEATEVAEETEQPAAGTEQPAAGGEAAGVGSICVLSYADANANGLRDADEARLAAITFDISDGTEVVGTYTTDGLSEPYCFSDLPAGVYVVSWTGDSGMMPTTSQTWSVELQGGSILTREFGVTMVSAEGSPEAEEERAGGFPTWATALIGALGVIIFLGGLGAAGYFLLIRRARI
jgi:LysM repeat protein